jgi:hypothetical protein
MVIKDIMKHEGFRAFFKGLTPKVRIFDCSPSLLLLNCWLTNILTRYAKQVLVVGPKLIFSFTMAQSLIPIFGKYV